MAKFNFNGTGAFSLIPEGVTVFKVTKVVDTDDDPKASKFGRKITVTLQTKEGKRPRDQEYTITRRTKSGGFEINEKGCDAFKWFGQNCLNNFGEFEADANDLVGCYIQATVSHEPYDYVNKDGERKTGTGVKLSDYTPASGFVGSSTAKSTKPEELDEDDDIDLDDFLDDED